MWSADGEARWRALSAEGITGMAEWRAQHPRALLQELEAALDERLAHLRARLLQDTVLASAATDVSQLPADERPRCPECGHTAVAAWRAPTSWWSRRASRARGCAGRASTSTRWWHSALWRAVTAGTRPGPRSPRSGAPRSGRAAGSGPPPGGRRLRWPRPRWSPSPHRPRPYPAQRRRHTRRHRWPHPPGTVVRAVPLRITPGATLRSGGPAVPKPYAETWRAPKTSADVRQLRR